MKQAFLQRRPFILNSQMRVLKMKTTSMLKLFGRNLILSHWRITTTCTICVDVLLLANNEYVGSEFDPSKESKLISYFDPYITPILRLNIGITHNYSSLTLTLTLTLSHMKLRPQIFTRISIPTLRNGLTLVTIQLIIHLELRQDLIVKWLKCLGIKLVGSRLLNLLVWG